MRTDPFLHPGEIVPLPEFVPAFAEFPDAVKAHPLVEAQAVRREIFVLLVGARDARVEIHNILRPADGLERRVQPAAQPGAAAFGAQVDRRLRRPVARGAADERPGVRVAEDLAVLLRDKVRVPDQRALDPAPEFLKRGRFVFKRDGRPPDVRRVDGKDGRRVLRRRDAHDCALSHDLSPL